MCGKSVVVVYVKGVGVYMCRVCVGGCVWCMYRRVCVVCVWEEYGSCICGRDVCSRVEGCGCAR